MNLSQIKQLQTVDGWVDFSAQIIEVKESKIRTQKNRLMTKVKLKDETDEIGAWLYADKQQFIPNQIITANGMLKEYENRRYIDYATVKSTQQAPQNAPQAPSRAPQGNKDRLIVAQVVYKAMASMYPGQVTEGIDYMGGFDVWLMGNQLVLKRHVDLIMQIGAGETPQTSKQMAQEFEDTMPPPIADGEIPPF